MIGSMIIAAARPVDNALAALEAHGNGLRIAPFGRAINREMQVRHRRMARVARTTDFIALVHNVADVDKCTVPGEVVVLACRAVAMQDDDVVCVATAAFFPATARIVFHDAGNDTSARRVHGRALRHVEVNRELLETLVAEARIVALQNTVGLAGLIGQGVDVVVVVFGVFVAHGPFKIDAVFAAVAAFLFDEFHRRRRLERAERSRHGRRPLDLEMGRANAERVGHGKVLQVSCFEVYLVAALYGINTYGFVLAARLADRSRAADEQCGGQGQKARAGNPAHPPSARAARRDSSSATR